ncbi:MAG: AhpC/TSA family protein [Bacteroidaceae bacterium]|nr:AhpC/TSA family protein [Bacteroidaceae bacterium]
MKKFYLSLIFAAAFASCTSNNTYTITGKFENYRSDMVWLINRDGTIDSVATADGSFTFKGTVDEPMFAYIVDNPNTRGANLTCRFLLEPGKMKMSDMLDYETYVMYGTKTNDKMAAFAKKELELTRYYEENEEKEGIQAEVDEQYTEMLTDGVKDNYDNLFGLSLMSDLSYELAPETVVEMLDRFSTEMKQNSTWTRIMSAAEKKMKTSTGKDYIDFSQESINGGMISASQVIGESDAKYVLIDFWASWCGPCMGEVPYLKETYSRYSKKGFQILGVSLDQNGDSWRKAVKDNDMNWIHVSDLQYWNNAAAALYGVNSIPANFLIDCKTGKIIATSLRGANLEKKISELLD